MGNVVSILLYYRSYLFKSKISFTRARLQNIEIQQYSDRYRSGTFNSKSFFGKVLLRFK